MSKLVQKGLSVLFNSPVITVLSANMGDALTDVLKEHFTFSSEEIANNFQQSYAYAMVAIGSGLATKENQRGFLKSIFQSKIKNEFSQQLTQEYLHPFAEQQGWEGARLAAFRDSAVKECQKMAQLTLFEKQHCAFSANELATFLTQSEPTSMTELVLDLLKPRYALDQALFSCLCFKELLGNAVLFFLQEQLRKEPRFQTTLAHLQAQGLSLDLSEIKTLLQSNKEQVTQAMAQNEFSKLAELGQKLQQLEQINTLSDTHYQQFMQFQRYFEQWSQLATIRLEKIFLAMPRLSQQIAAVKDDTEQILALLHQLMRQNDVSIKIKPRDELTQINRPNLKLLQHALKLSKGLSLATPEYSHIAMQLGSVVATQGDLKQAKQLFSQAYQQADNDNERALSQFNLFQIAIREQDYPEAFSALQQAIALQPAKYALHSVHNYHIQAILGAGGMGCVFLAKDRFSKKQVVIKCFWETLHGSAKNLFKEAFLMAKIAGDYIPRPLSCGFVDEMQQQRGYFVAEYIQGTLDGEAWLKKHGAFDLQTGLKVALQIAKGLQCAHSKGVYHLDLKPANLLLQARDNQAPAVKIIDFGLAKVAPSLGQEMAAQGAHSGLSVMAQAAIFGTRDYAPPEQQGINDYGLPSAKSDIYALGKTLYRLFTAQSPQTLHPRPLKDQSELYELLCDCTEIDPVQRPDIEALIKRLQQLLIEPEMVLIPAGEFIMGCLESVEKTIKQGRDDVEGGCYEWEKPAHKVTLQAFRLAKYAVTFAEFDVFCDATGFKKPDYAGWGRKRRPVIIVSWEDAQQYINWLNQNSDKSYRLASEAEWEYAARANTDSAYPWGNSVDHQSANYGQKIGKTTPVGHYPANDFGLFDLHGNVWEWVQDKWHDNYKQAPNDGSAWESGNGAGRGLRGGSWDDTPRDLRSADRFRGTPDDRNSISGFRLARSE
jgi:formylglycine-generating enzyme required for sulfatase activity